MTDKRDDKNWIVVILYKQPNLDKIRQMAQQFTADKLLISQPSTSYFKQPKC